MLHVLHKKSPQEAVDMMAEETIGIFSNQTIPETVHPSQV